MSSPSSRPNFECAQPTMQPVMSLAPLAFSGLAPPASRSRRGRDLVLAARCTTHRQGRQFASKRMRVARGPSGPRRAAGAWLASPVPPRFLRFRCNEKIVRVRSLRMDSAWVVIRGNVRGPRASRGGRSAATVDTMRTRGPRRWAKRSGTAAASRVPASTMSTARCEERGALTAEFPPPPPTHPAARTSSRSASAAAAPRRSGPGSTAAGSPAWITTAGRLARRMRENLAAGRAPLDGYGPALPRVHRHSLRDSGRPFRRLQALRGPPGRLWRAVHPQHPAHRALAAHRHASATPGTGGTAPSKPPVSARTTGSASPSAGARSGRPTIATCVPCSPPSASWCSTSSRTTRCCFATSWGCPGPAPGSGPRRTSRSAGSASPSPLSCRGRSSARFPPGSSTR